MEFAAVTLTDNNKIVSIIIHDQFLTSLSILQLLMMASVEGEMLCIVIYQIHIFSRL